jgi:hypothetical protein
MAGAEGAAIGAAVGAVGPPAVETMRNIGIALQMKSGRALIKGLLQESDGALTPKAIGAIGAFSWAVTRDPAIAKNDEMQGMPEYSRFIPMNDRMKRP